jgi:hypothetical protein
MSDAPDSGKRSRTARIALWLGAGGPALTLVGILLSQLGLPPMIGFRFFTFALLLGLLALLVGAVAIFLTRGGVGGRRDALTGLGLGILMVLVVLVGASPGAGAPPINDITTNLEDPPSFVPAPSGHRNEGRDMGYPADWAPLVREAYPDLTPIRVGLSPADAYALAIAQAEGLGWTITRRDPAALVFEAEDVTALFRFVDDVSIRVRDDGSGRAVIDARSKSRDGRGDVGANAARIRTFATSVIEGQSGGVAAGQ